MKVYTKLVFDKDGLLVEQEYEQYEGPVAECKGPEPAQPAQPIAGRVVKDLWKNDPNFMRRLRSVYAPNEQDPYRDLAVNRMVNDINAQYGARGLASSGIGLKGVTDAITNFDVTRKEQKTNQGIAILGTASGAPNVIPGKQGSGFMGLKAVLFAVMLAGYTMAGSL